MLMKHVDVLQSKCGAVSPVAALYVITFAVTEWRAGFAVSPHSHCNSQRAMKAQVPNCVDFMVEPP